MRLSARVAPCDCKVVGGIDVSNGNGLGRQYSPICLSQSKGTEIMLKSRKDGASVGAVVCETLGNREISGFACVRNVRYDSRSKQGCRYWRQLWRQVEVSCLNRNAFHPRKGKPVERRRRKAMGLHLLGRLLFCIRLERLPRCRRGRPVKHPSVPGCPTTSARFRDRLLGGNIPACLAFFASISLTGCLASAKPQAVIRHSGFAPMTSQIRWLGHAAWQSKRPASTF